MAMTEHEGLQIYKDASGNSFILYPITKAHLVDGFEEAVMALAGVADGLAKFAHDHAAGDIKTGVLPIERGGTGGNTAAAALEALGVPAAISAAITASGAARVQVGSYVGTGTYGASNKNTLIFGFEPKLVILENATGYSGMMLNGIDYARIQYLAHTQSAFVLSWSGNTLSWYCTKAYYANGTGAESTTSTTNVSAAYQYNQSGATYRYVAIG